MSQTLFPGRPPEEYMQEAIETHDPARIVVGFSGGGDSSVVTHWAVTNGWTKDVFHIDTGTALPGVREHVDGFVEKLGANLIVYEAGDFYRHLVLGLGCPEGRDEQRPALRTPLGFPGPAGHGRCFTWLKRNQIRKLVRDTRKELDDPKAEILIIGGVRRAESARRRSHAPIHRPEAGTIFVSPMIEWDGDDMRRYREENDLHPSDVAALLHMSGECTCGAFAAPGERQMIKDLWPEWWEENHGKTEREAEALGLDRAVWGAPAPAKEVRKAIEEDAGEFCSSCQLRLDVEGEEKAA